MAGHSKAKTEELTEMVNRSAAAGHYVDGQLAPDQSMTAPMRAQTDTTALRIRPQHGPVALRALLQTVIPVTELAQMLWRGCQEPVGRVTAADKRVCYDYRVYVTNQIIGAPRQTVAVEDVRPEESPWAVMMGALVRDLAVIEGESRVVEEGAAPPLHAGDVVGAQPPTITEAEDGPEPT